MRIKSKESATITHTAKDQKVIHSHPIPRRHSVATDNKTMTERHTRQIDFEILVLAPIPNQFLMLPRGFKSASKPHIRSPDFSMSEVALARKVEEAILSHPGTRLVMSYGNEKQMLFEVRSAVFGFPDYVTVEAVDLGPTRSALALYSRSRFGITDLGTNRRRTLRWLKALLNATEAQRRPECLDFAVRDASSSGAH
jgi:uncharacterized protein (DUF1499 family)